MLNQVPNSCYVGRNRAYLIPSHDIDFNRNICELMSKTLSFNLDLDMFRGVSFPVSRSDFISKRKEVASSLFSWSDGVAGYSTCEHKYRHMIKKFNYHDDRTVNFKENCRSTLWQNRTKLRILPTRVEGRTAVWELHDMRFNLELDAARVKFNPSIRSLFPSHIGSHKVSGALGKMTDHLQCLGNIGDHTAITQIERVIHIFLAI
ncbi:hypothetical protein BDR07DRAFT_1465240 [Suillus spraguei]|nr:hypothetical protein BDR07DRAFT_1465240 [Suillus spraguei]